uniref:Uncharacterized protein n=1 Tax=Hemiselmis andersenii TaxID=464988 RepID=A0A7S0TII0_HEMAN
MCLSVIHGVYTNGNVQPHRDPRMLVAYKGETVGAVRRRLMRQEEAGEEEEADEDNWQLFWMAQLERGEHRMCEDLDETFALDDDQVSSHQLWVFSPEDPQGPSQSDFWAPSCQIDRGRIRIATSHQAQ